MTYVMSEEDFQIVSRFVNTRKDEDGHYIEKIATWIPVSNEALEDGKWMRLRMEYAFRAERLPPTPRERVTGWRSFTSSDGLTGEFRVGWRLELWQFFRRERCAIQGHPFGEWETEDGYGHRSCICGKRTQTAEPSYPE